MQFLKVNDNGLTISESEILSILIDITSYPWALLTIKDFIILRMSWSVKVIKDSLNLVLYIKLEGIEYYL